jgi:tRNA A-37 threonylcarbamoyl transferase component Bud32
MTVTPVHDAPRSAPRQPDDGELLLARVRVAVADRYDGLREIGRGGMAVVYAARDRKLNRDIALKVLPPELAYRVDVRERFVREAQTAARLNHPSIVPIYAVDEADGLVYFVMALVQGESLASRLGRERKPPLRFVRQVLAQVADALAYAHRSGVVHRDIKPDNILLEHATGRAVVTDFGIARAVESSGARLTQTGIAVGTPAFMSPEQAMGQRDVDGRSDVYALGLVGFLMLAGRLPFDAETSAGQLLQRVQGTPFPLANFRPDLPFSMVDAITRAIAREPSARWPDAASFAAALRAGDGDDVSSTGATAGASARDEQAPPPRAVDPARASVVDALDRMNASLSIAGDQLRRGAAAGRAAALAVPAVPARPVADARRALRSGQAGDDAVDASGGGELRADRALRVLQDWKRRAKWVLWPAVAGVAGVIGVGATNGEPPMIVLMLGAGLLASVNALRLVRQTFRLRDVGLGVRDAIGERWQDKIDAMRGYVPAESTAPARGPSSRLTPPQRLERARTLVPAFMRRLKWTGGAAALSIGSLIVGVSVNEEAFIAPMLVGGAVALASAALSFRHWRRLRALGLTARDALGDSWEAKLDALDDRSRSVRQSDELARLADDETLRSAYGRILREAVDDRLTIRETWGKLDAADRELVPDVAPTADALLERVVALATSLARLEGAVESHALPSLDQRIDEAQRATPSADQERRLALLTRQRASLAELVERQTALESQLDRASLALRSLRLDVVKLRALGIGSAIGDVTSATQEARAISADIGRALDVADELRRI